MRFALVLALSLLALSQAGCAQIVLAVALSQGGGGGGGGGSGGGSTPTPGPGPVLPHPVPPPAPPPTGGGGGGGGGGGVAPVASPTAPTALIASAVNASQVVLNWSDGANETGLRVERSPSGAGTWSSVSTLAAEVTSYTDAAPNPDTSYDYRVVATNASGSAISNLSSSTTFGAVKALGCVPDEGLLAGNVTVTVYGDNFQDPGAGTLQVRFGTQLASDVVVLDGQRLTCKVPAHSSSTQGALVDLQIESAANGDSTRTRCYAYGRSVSHQDFSSGPLDALLEDAEGGFEITGGRIQRLDQGGLFDRRYIRTQASDFNQQDVVYELTLSSDATPGTRIGFVGIGAGAPDAANTEEPLESINFRIHPSNVASGRVDVTSVGAIGSTTGGVNRVRISKIGTTAYFEFDANYSPPFVPDFSATVDLAAEASFFGANDTHLFFGTWKPDIWFDDLTITTLEVPSAPTAPSGLVAVYGAQAEISWTDNADNEAGYRLERRLAGGTFATIATLGADVTSYTDAGAATLTHYEYRVSALNSGGTSSSATVSIVAKAPSGLSATSISAAVDLAWTNTGTYTTISVQRRTGTNAFTTLAAIAGNAVRYTDAAVTAETSYDYRVIGNGPGGPSDPSASASVTTHPAPGVLVHVPAGSETSENGRLARISVRLSAPPRFDVSVDLEVLDTSEAKLVSAATLTFTTASALTSQSVILQGLPDDLYDGDVGYTLRVKPASSADPNFFAADGPDPALINRDGAGPRRVILRPLDELAETSEGGATCRFYVSLSGKPTADVTIPLTSSDTSEGTVSPASLTFTSANYWQGQLVTVTGVGDALDDGDVTYFARTGAATSGDGAWAGVDGPDLELRNADDDGGGANTAPRLVSSEGNRLQAWVGTQLRTTLIASDSDGDQLSLRLLNPPPQALCEPVAGGGPFVRSVLRWVPQFVGHYELLFAASDGATTTQLRVVVDVTLPNDPGVVPGDVTGDGVSDVLVPAPSASIEGVQASGALYLWAGSPLPNGEETARLILPSAATKDFLGRGHLLYLHLEDVSGDGVLDVVLGASEVDDEGVENRGVILVWLGGPHLRGDCGPHAKLRVSSSVKGLVVGRRIQLHDLNRDGVPDVVSGGAGATSPWGVSKAGSIYVWYGGAELAGVKTPDAILADPAASSSDQLSDFALRVGDVTGDGLPDLVANAPSADAGGGDNGAFYVWSLASPPSGVTTPTAKLAVADAMSVNGNLRDLHLVDLTGDGVADVVGLAQRASAGGVPRGSAFYVWAGGPGLAGSPAPTATPIKAAPEAGRALLVSHFVDIDADGVLDLLSVSPHSGESANGAGAIFYWRGGPTLSGVVTETAVLIVQNAQPFDQLGWEVLVAEVTGDDKLDVVASAPRADLGGVRDRGSLYVWAGGSLAGDVFETASLQVPGGFDSDFLGGTAQFGREAGDRRTLLGDLDGDGTFDVVTAASEANHAGKTNNGALYVWFGGSALTGVQAPAATLSDPAGADEDRLGSPPPATTYVVNFLLTDLHDDGRLDVVVGNSRADAGGQSNSGVVLVWAGGVLNGTPAPSATLATGVARDALTHVEGQGLLVADFDGDGTQDLLVGAAHASNHEGRIFVWRGGTALSGTPAVFATLGVPGATLDDRLGNDRGGSSRLQGIQLLELNGDDRVEVVARAYLANVAGVVDAGAVYVWDGTGLVGASAPAGSLRAESSQAGDRLGDTN